MTFRELAAADVHLPIMSPILLLGPPRSGSTWVSEVLAAVPNSLRVHEPDSDPHQPFALLAKAGIGRYPIIAAGDDAGRYGALWRAAFQSAERGRGLRDVPARALLRSTDLATRNAILFDTPDRRSRLVERGLRLTARPFSPEPADLHVIKSVHSPLAAGFVASLTDARVVVIRRNPLNAVASWLELGWLPQVLGSGDAEERALGDELGAAPPGPDAPIEARHAWSYSALTRCLDVEAAEHPNWVVVQHEDLCNDPIGRFGDLFSRLGLDFDARIEATLASNDTAAEGYTTKRVASEQAERWKTRLDARQVELITSIAASLSIDC